MSKRFVDSFVIAEAAALCGLSAYMLDYLCRVGVLMPSAGVRRGRGRARRYSFGDVVMLRAISQLLAAGLSVQRLKVALRALRPYHNKISATSTPAKYLVTNGTDVFFKDGNKVFDLDGSGQMTFLFVLEIADLQRQVISEQKKRHAHAVRRSQ